MLFFIIAYVILVMFILLFNAGSHRKKSVKINKNN